MDDSRQGDEAKRSRVRQEVKADATTRASRDITDHEKAERKAKTARLRAARLAHEATLDPLPPTRKAKKKK